MLCSLKTTEKTGLLGLRLSLSESRNMPLDAGWARGLQHYGGNLDLVGLLVCGSQTGCKIVPEYHTALEVCGGIWVFFCLFWVTDLIDAWVCGLRMDEA